MYTLEQAQSHYLNPKFEYEDMEQENYKCIICGDIIEDESNVCWENGSPFCSKECIQENNLYLENKKTLDIKKSTQDKKELENNFKLTAKFGSEIHLI
jgi:hypothetical protein